MLTLSDYQKYLVYTLENPSKCNFQFSSERLYYYLNFMCFLKPGVCPQSLASNGCTPDYYFPESAGVGSTITVQAF